MEFLREFPHDFFQAGMENPIRIESSGHQRIVLFARHGENQPMRDDRGFGLRREFVQMVLPAFGDTAFALIVGKLRGSRAASVRVSTDVMMEKSSSVNLTQRFLGSVVREVFQLPADLLLHVGALAQRNFPVGSFIEVFEIQPPASGGFSREDLSVFHVSESRISSV